MAFLFDTNAVSELLRKRPAPLYLDWIAQISREDQFTSAVSIGELYRGAYRSEKPDFHLERIESQILPSLTVLPFDTPTAKVYGRIYSHLASSGQILEDADLQIAATAIHHGLDLVTGNLRHFERIPGIRLDRALADARSALP